MKKYNVTKIIMAVVVFIFTFAFMPFNSFANGEDKTSTVEALAETGNVTQNVGNITITSRYYGDEARGISASAEDGHTATVTAKDIDVNVNNNDILFQRGVSAYCETGGKINITTQKITSKGQGIDTTSDGQGCEVSITTGDIQGGAYGGGAYLPRGIDAAAYENGKLNIVVNGDVSNSKIGAHIRGCGANNKGKVNVTVNGDVTASDTALGIGLTFMGTSDTADVLVTGVLAGGKFGVNTNVDSFYYPDLGANKLTVWKISAPNNNLVVKQTDWREVEESFEVDNDYAKKINYIIKHDENVAPKKANGSNLDVSHEYPVAKEGERVIITPADDGVIITKAFNNGVEITTVDKNGNFYVDVRRGGGIDLSIEAESLGDKTPLNNATITLNKSSCTYNGQVQKPIVTVKINNKTLTNGTDYTVTYSDENPLNAGDYIVTVTGIGGYKGTKSATFTINKALNPMELKGKTIKAKASILAKKQLSRQIGKVIKITNAKGSLSYKKTKGKKKILIDKNTGKITIKKGIKKGKYKISVNVTASGDENYNDITSLVMFTVNVK